MSIDPVDSAIEQIEYVKHECIDLISRIKSFAPPDEKGNYHDTFRLIATPMLYSAWERCFTLCHAVALRLIRDVTTTASTLPPSQRAIWLQKTPFYASLVTKLRTVNAASHGDINKGEFSNLCDFLSELDNWLCCGLDKEISADRLVMTFSNVNPDVVEINAKAIGISESEKFKQLRLGRLHDLVGQRNGIGHGAIINPPTNENFRELLSFSENSVKEYCDVFVDWMKEYFKRVKGQLDGIENETPPQ